MLHTVAKIMELGSFNLINISPSKSQFLNLLALISEKARMTHTQKKNHLSEKSMLIKDCTNYKKHTILLILYWNPIKKIKKEKWEQQTITELLFCWYYSSCQSLSIKLIRLKYCGIKFENSYFLINVIRGKVFIYIMFKSNPFKTDNSTLNRYIIGYSLFISIEIFQQKCSLNYSHMRK